MDDKGLFNLAYFLTEYLFDVLWVLVRTILSPIFVLGWLLTDDRALNEYDWWPG